MLNLSVLRLILLKALCGNPILPFKMEIKLIYTEGVCV